MTLHNCLSITLHIYAKYEFILFIVHNNKKFYNFT